MNNILTSTFKKLYNSSEEFLKGLKEGLVERRNLRALEASIDSAEEQQLTAEANLSKELEVVKEGNVINFNNVLKNIQTIKDCQETIKQLKEFKDSFFTDK